MILLLSKLIFILFKVETIKASCPEFSIFDPCPSTCPPKTCENLNDECKKDGCGEKRCSCRSGFVQLTDDISDGCIPEDECFPTVGPTPKLVEEIEGSGEEFGEEVELSKNRDSRSDKCPEHSELQDCVPYEPINCYTLVCFIFCFSEYCTECFNHFQDSQSAYSCGEQRCECIDGYVRADSGDEAPCVLIDQCPNLI